MSKYKDIALSIIETAKNLGWELSVDRDILVAKKSITPNDSDSFTKADGEYYSILGKLPQTELGSIWGTTGDTVGALSAVKSGVFHVKKSGGSKHVLNWIKKLNK